MDTTLEIEQIKDALNSVPYPITAGYLEQLTNISKSTINKLLYANKDTHFEQLKWFSKRS